MRLLENKKVNAKGQVINKEVLDKIGCLCLESSRARDSLRGSKAYRELLIKELPMRAIYVAIKINWLLPVETPLAHV